MSSPRVWFITGSSTGFGRLLAEIALENGEKVVATLRKPEVLSDLESLYGSDKLLVVKLDVTKQEEIFAAFAKAKEVFGRIDIVFNNAGYLHIGEAEGVPEDEARKIFEVSFWGAASITNAAIQFFRDVNEPAGGILFQMSSIAGVTALLNTGYYSAAKFAVDGLTESLAKELDPNWNIKVVLLCPGAYRTPIFTKNVVMLPTHSAYASNPSLPSSVARATYSSMATTGEWHPALGDPKKLMKQIYAISNLPEIPFRVPLGPDALSGFKDKYERIKADMEKSEPWSKDLH